jgi:hypothetical protein
LLKSGSKTFWCKQILKKYVLTFFGIVVLLIISISCYETIEINDPDIFNPAIQGEIKMDTIYAQLDTTYSIPEQSTASASRLLTGTFSGLTCRPVLKFTNLPTNATFSEVFFKFFSSGHTGTDTQSFNVKAYLITQNWSNNLDSVWNEPGIIDTIKSLGSMEVTVPDSSDQKYTLEVDSINGLPIINSWADEDSSDFNYGFILSFDNASFINNFHSTANLNSRGPLIVFEYTLPEDTTVFKDSSFATVDAYLIDGNFSLVPNRDYALSLTPWVTLLQFDTEPFLKQFPQGVIISSANLQLSYDESNSLPLSNAGLSILPLESELDDSTVVTEQPLGSIFQISVNQISEDSSFVEIIRGSERRDFAQLYWQETLEDPQPIKKLYLGFTSNINFLTYFAFFKRNTADTKMRPRVILEYWIPPNPRF